ncbi:MAG: hypothetical protein N2111_09660 [Candidatus Sumerlaeaceae bacterium]|nr:hypothetical protein [Candidatus Sumerlaeaceae bacterium]
MDRVRAVLRVLVALVMIPIEFFRRWFLPLHSDDAPDEFDDEDSKE